MRSGFRLLRSALSLFDRRTRMGFAGFALGFAVFSFLDAVALVLVAIALSDTGAIAQGADTVKLPSSLRSVGAAVGMGSSVSLAALVAATLCLMLAKSVLAAWFTRRSVRFFARHDTALGKRIISRQLNATWLEHTQRDESETQRDAVFSSTALVQEFLGAVVLSWAEVCTIVAIAVAVLFSDPLVALVGGLYAVVLASALQHYVRGRMNSAGEQNFRAEAAVLKTMQQALSTFKELLVRGRTSVFADVAALQRRGLAEAHAETTYVTSLARYVLEGGLVIGIGLVGTVAIIVDGAASAAGAIVFFAAAGFRVLPAIQRLQVNLATARYRTPYIRTVLDQLEPQRIDDLETPKLELDGPRLRGRVELRHLSFSYPARVPPALNCVSLDILEGQRVALVGPTGAGKTTLADAVLGLLNLEPGSVLVDGADILESLPEWRRSVGYVPQVISLVDDSVAANVALGWLDADIDRERVWRALEKAQADQFVRELPNGLDTHLGERGVRIAGGQRQRIGIARALYTRPSFLVLDEATSALDVETERMVMEAVENLHGEITVLVVAHRLATVRSADLVVFIEDGEVRAQGTFGEVVRAVPRFAEHARLAGLSASEG
jgi:ATP-binding cassette, subfamily B, bacterial PglK